jgi:hypothetical protein
LRGCYCRWNEIVHVNGKRVEREYPSRPGELSSPDDVKLQDVGLDGAGVEPLNIQLMALVGGIRRDTQLDRDTRVGLAEPVELTPRDGRFGTQPAAGEGQSGRSWGVSTRGSSHCRQQREPQSREVFRVAPHVAQSIAERPQFVRWPTEPVYTVQNGRAMEPSLVMLL